MKNSLFGKIETKEEALKVIKDISIFLYFLAALSFILGLIYMGGGFIGSAVIYVIITFLLRQYNSRIVAVVLLILPITELIITGFEKISGDTANINLLNLIMIWIAIRAIQATYKVRKFQQTPLK